MKTTQSTLNMARVHLCVIGVIVWLIATPPQALRAGERTDGAVIAIPDVLVHVDPDVGKDTLPLNVVIVDKARQQLRLYGYRDRWRTIAKWACSTGKQSGPKEMEGDRKTPNGIYFAVRQIEQQFLSDTYGSRALPLDYPNELDRRHARTGSAIWLHGTDKTLQPRDSNGCVVLENRVIDRLARNIRLNRTPVIIVERIGLWPEKRARSLADRVLSTARRWNDTMMKGGYQDYCRFYDTGAKPSMRWWRQWRRCRGKQGNGDALESVVRRRTIYRSGCYFVLLFDHILKRGTQEQWAGYRKLYLNVEEDRVSIMADVFQASPKTGDNPLFYAWQKLWQKSEQRSRMAATLNGDKKS